MEGRECQDANVARRSGTFSGRQVPLEMGTVRLGGSGRPVPAVFTAASRRGASASHESVGASSAALSPRVNLEPHPRSPFRRKDDLAKTVVRVSDSRFQVKKVTGPHPLSARSPQIRTKRRRSTTDDFSTHSAEVKSYQDNGTELSVSVDEFKTERIEQTEQLSQQHQQMAPETMEKQQIDCDVKELSRWNQGDTSAVDLLLTKQQKGDVSANESEENILETNSENIRPPELPGRKAFALPSANAGAGTFVSSMPSLTKVRSSFTARELALFTHRLETSEQEVNTRTRYHVASHPHSTKTTISSLVPRTNQTRERTEESRVTYKRALPLSTTRSEPGTYVSKETQKEESSWKRVDTSIDHIYEDPSIDMVQLHLLHGHHTTNGQKKRKMVERERVLAAAIDLREHQSEEQRRQEQLQQRKIRIQKMSEAIRLQNQKAVRMRAAHSAGLHERREKSGRRSESGPALPERKPPVPRLSRTGTSARRKQKPKDDGSRSHGGVSASILMDLTSDPPPQLETGDDVNDTADNEESMNSPASHHTMKRKPPSTTPRSSKKKRQGATQPPEPDAAVQAREERRAIAREYMQLQKHSRRIWSEKAKEQSQREQAKRQQQLEILEATRLKKLRLSKKRSKIPETYDIEGPVAADDSPSTNVMMSFVHTNSSKNAVQSDIIDKLTKVDESSENNKSGKVDFDEPNLDNENDQTIGNTDIHERSLYRETAMTSSNTKPTHKDISVQEADYSNRVDERVRKLLELREKAAMLSARLSGLRNRTSNTESNESTKEMLEHKCFEITHQGLADGEFAEPISDIKTNTLVKSDIHKIDQDTDYAENNDYSSGDRIEQDDGSVTRRINDSSSEVAVVEENIHVDGGQAPQNFDDESLVVTKSRRDIGHNLAFYNAADETGIYDVKDGGDIDVRSIGVYNIGVVWPIQHDENKSANFVSETKQTMLSVSESSSSSSSTAASSPRDSHSRLRRKEWLADLSESREEKEEEFETVYYQQLKSRLQTSSMLDTGEMKGVREKETGEEVKSALEPEADMELFPGYASHKRLFSANQDIIQRRERNSWSSQSDAGLMRLIQETDDSLSVIDREARKMFHEQLERSEREREKELQERIKGEKKELREKEMAIKAVMASITGRKSGSEEGWSGRYNDEHTCDDDNEMQSAQYKRLEEIMDEVENERAQGNEGTDRSLDNKSTDEFDHQSSSELKQPRFQDTKTNVRHRGGKPVSPSSTFWDQLVSEMTDNEFNDHPGHGRSHVEIDDSELVAQRESRLRDDEQNGDHIDSPPRVHSPRTLSKRLMAAVDYQEAIFEAHIQLSRMGHAHELETVQAETITLAQAFKEEMEHNAASHQLALDHATLEKKFDSDMKDVMQELDTIRQVEEKERVANELQMEQEMKLANLRECSVQTEASQRVDAATSAALFVDMSTSPVRFVADAAVQHNDTTVQNTEASTSVNRVDHELEYASEEDSEPYDETFEKESQLQIDQLAHDMANTSDVPDSIAGSLTRSPLQSENDSESEIQSVLSEQAGENVIDESGEARSIADEESFADESRAVSAVVSVIDDEGIDQPDNLAESKVDESVSMNYDDDFEASSPKLRAVMSHDTVIDDGEDDLDGSKSNGRSENSDDIAEEVDGENGSIKTGEMAISEDIEDDYYSSQFDDTSRGDSKGMKNQITKQITTVVQVSETSTFLTLDQNRSGSPPTLGPHDLSLNIRETTETISAAYIIDLERRKQAEESLLNLRLRTVERKYECEIKQLEDTAKSEQLDTRAVEELKIRKETLVMAFLAEKANVESLKAASTAQYYQDLHTFRSLSLNWPHVVGRGIGGGQHKPYFQHTVMSPVVAAPPSFTIQSKDAEQNYSTRHDEYTDEFASDAESDNAEVAEEVNNDRDAEIAEINSIVSEQSEVESTKEPLDTTDASVMAEEENFEQENENNLSNSVQEEEAQYEDEFASMSADPSAQEDAIVEVEIAESSEIEDQAKEDSGPSDSEYDEDFASVSQSIAYQGTSPTKTSAAGMEIEESDVDKSDHASDVGEISSGRESAEDSHEPPAVEEEVYSDDIAEDNEPSASVEDAHNEEIESDQQKYSDDDFESGQLEQSGQPHPETMLGEQSVSLREVQSSLGDSSTTKLLVTEVATLQEAAGATYNAYAQAEDNKLTKKKVMVEELLHAKERLFNQQKEAFRRDEEKRQVDVLAKRALGVDVEGELRRAKAEISQQLASEFDTLQQTYPMLQVTSNITATAVHMKERKETLSPPSVMSKLFGKNSTPAVDDEYEEEYEAESFEEVQNDSPADDKASLSEHFSEVANYEDEVEKSQGGGQHGNDKVEIQDSNLEVVSDVPSHQSDISEDEIPSGVDEEYTPVDEQETSEVKAENDYENDYENESFDGVQSVPDDNFDNGDNDASISEETLEVINTKGETILDNPEYDEEDAYADEDFDDASESFANEAATSPITPQIIITNKVASTDTEILKGEISAEEEELAEAIGSVVAQLDDQNSTHPVSPAHLEPDFVKESAMNESKSLVTSVSVSVSHEEEEESLTKSIQERTERLQILKQKIEVRKSEILAVQKQMRVERRKEKLVAEEKLLCDEMEAVERLLYADETALALCRQRNRLETMYLEARQLEHSISRKPNQSVCEQESDLLLGFDYIEAVHSDGWQHRCFSNALLTSRGQVSRKFNLLDGYAYIEAVDPVEPNLSVPTLGTPLSQERNHGQEGNDASSYDNGVSTEMEIFIEPAGCNDNGNDGNVKPIEHTLMKRNERTSGEDSQENVGKLFTVTTGDSNAVSDDATTVDIPIASQGNDPDECRKDVTQGETDIGHTWLKLPDKSLSPTLRHDLLAKQDSIDLLAEYVYVEDAEVVSDSHWELPNADLLVGFDYVEVVDFIKSSTVNDTDRGQVHKGTELSENIVATDEEFQGLESSDAENEESKYENAPTELPVDCQTTDTPPQISHLSSVSAVSQEGPLREQKETIKESEDGGGDNFDSVGESIEGDKPSETPCVLNPLNSAIVVNTDLRLPSDEVPRPEVSREENIADRVSALLYADLYQDLEEDIVTVIRYRRAIQDQSDERKAQDTLNKDLTSIKKDARSITSKPLSDGLGIQIIEVESKRIDSADWSVEQSSESVLVGSTNNAPPNEVLDEDDASISSGDDSAISADFVDEESSHNAKADGEALREFPQSSGDTSKDKGIVIRNVAHDVKSSVDIINKQRNKSEQVSRDTNDVPDKERQSELIADAIFATVFDEILDSELQIWSSQRPVAAFSSHTLGSGSHSSESTSSIPTAVKTTREFMKRASGPDPTTRDHALAQRIVNQLEIVDGEIRLPPFDNLDVGNASSATHALYDIVEDLARDCFNAIQQCASVNDNSLMLSVIHRHIQTEIEELLAIRAHSEHELERQLQLLSDETDAESGVTSDLLLSQNCVASNVNNIVSKVQSDLSKTTEELSSVVQATPVTLLPRTPISRAKSTSILSSLQTQQDQELQQRITSMIFSDLLHDGLS